MRGNPIPSLAATAGVWSIPAYAGEPGSPSLPTPPDMVYPRVCGGTEPVCNQPSAAGEGLSPRMRGNPAGLPRQGTAGRSIPAYAGEPATAGPVPSCTAVYPRVCGGTTGRESQLRITPGLSPRMRGNRGNGAGTGAAAGSIPAYAGEPFMIMTRMRMARVYPRVCGGTCGGKIVAYAGQGLSPRMRGNPGARWAR